MDGFIWTVHTAGAPIGWVQSCIACGLAIVDNSAWGDGRVAAMEADADRGPAWFPEGALVGTDKRPGVRGGCTYTVDDRPLDGDERLCAGVN